MRQRAPDDFLARVPAVIAGDDETPTMSFRRSPLDLGEVKTQRICSRVAGGAFGNGLPVAADTACLPENRCHRSTMTSA